MLTIQANDLTVRHQILDALQHAACCCLKSGRKIVFIGVGSVVGGLTPALITCICFISNKASNNWSCEMLEQLPEMIVGGIVIGGIIGDRIDNKIASLKDKMRITN
jgi:hypothetical protein